MSKPILVSCCDSNYFLMASVLMHSLKRCAPGLELHVLDFGVTDIQARFLEKHCRLMRRPDDVPSGSHPFFYKSQTASFMRGVDWSTMVCIDSDMIVVGAFEAAINTLIAEMTSARKQTAICRDGSGTLAGIIAGGLPMQPFLDLLAARRIPRETPCYNGGFFVCRSPDMIRALDALGRATPVHSLFDQNLLNVMIAEDGPPVELSSRVWNLHGKLLREATLGEVDGRPTLLAQGERPLVLHLTSSHEGDVSVNSGLRLGDMQVAGTLRLFGNPALRAVQDFVLQDFGATYLDELARDGIATKA